MAHLAARSLFGAISVLERVAWSSIPTQKSYARFVHDVRAEVANLVQTLGASMLDGKQFADQLDEILTRAHARAYALGRHRAGDMKPQGRDDLDLANVAMDSQAEFLARFGDKIDDGGFNDQFGFVDLAQVAKRADFYLDRLRGSANEGFVLGSGDALFDWITVGENCAGCNALAKKSPHKASKMTHFPGDGQTECQVRCDCILRRRSDRRAGFARVDLTKRP